MPRHSDRAVEDGPASTESSEHGMRELEVGERIQIENYQSVVVWQGSVSRAGGNLVVIADDQPPPVDLKPNAPVRVCFSEQRWLTKVRGRVLERESHNLKILLIGHGERVQRRTHVRVPLNQAADVAITRRDCEFQVVTAEVVDVSEGGFQLRSDAAFVIGDLVQLKCCLNRANVQLAGQVVRTWRDGESHVAGVRATGLAPSAHNAVARFVIECSLTTRQTDPLSGRRRTGA